MSDDTKALVERLRHLARGLMTASLSGDVGLRMRQAADTIERLERDRDGRDAENAKLREDAERLDVIERCIRDGKRAGREDMRERAAKVCDEHDPTKERIAKGRRLSEFTADSQSAILDEERAEKIAAAILATAIRALGVDDD